MVFYIYLDLIRRLYKIHHNKLMDLNRWVREDKWTCNECVIGI